MQSKIKTKTLEAAWEAVRSEVVSGTTSLPGCRNTRRSLLLSFRERFCTFVTCLKIIGLMLAQAVRLTMGAQKGKLPFSTHNTYVIESLTKCTYLCSFTLKAVKSRILLIQQRRSLRKRLRISSRYVSASAFWFIALKQLTSFLWIYVHFLLSPCSYNETFSLFLMK